MNVPNGAVYKIVLSKQIRDKLRRLHQKASAKGHGSKVIAAVKQITDRLRMNPVQFGEPLFFLSQANLEVRVGGVAPLLVTYAVHQQQRVVFIRDFTLSLGADS